MKVSPITHIRYVAHAVPEFEATLEYYAGVFGLRTVEADKSRAHLAAEGSTEPFVLRLRKADDKHLDLISFAAVDVATVDRLAAEFIKADVRIDRLPGTLNSPGGGYGFRCFDPDGRLLEISADVTPRAARTLDEGESIPVKISHIVLNSPKLDVTRRFYEERLGFSLRDRIADFMYFLYVGVDHHVMAITNAPHASFNHVAFEMRGLNEFLLGHGRLARQGIRPVFGPGRHGTGDNTFDYFVDPAGNLAEYTQGLLQIPDPASYPLKTWGFTPQEMDQWGTSGPHDEFVAAAVGSPDPLPWTSSPD